MCPLNIGEDRAGQNFGVGGVGQKNNMGKCFTI